MVEAMTEDTFSQAAMLFDLQRLDPYQPVPGTISPTEAERHQSNQLPQPFFVRHMRGFQTKASRLQTTKQSLNTPSAGVIGKQQLAFFGAADEHILAITAPQSHHKEPLSQHQPRAREQHARACTLCAEEVARRHPLRVARVLDQQVLFQPQAEGDALPTQEGQPVHPDKLSVSTNKFNTLPPEQPQVILHQRDALARIRTALLDRKSTRLNSSHANISYAVFCLKKKKHNP